MPKGKKTQSPLPFTVSYSIGREAAHKDAAWVLLTYLTGPDGMKVWTGGGVANPSRKDVSPAPGKDVFTRSASFATPWAFTPGFSKVIDAFNNAMTAAVEGNGSADTVTSKAKQALDAQLSGP